MPYAKKWGAPHPGCLIFLLDQSGSMQDPIGSGQIGEGRLLMDAVATVLNNCINEIGRRSVDKDVVKPRVHIAVIGYGGSYVGSVLAGDLAGRELVSISELMDNPLRKETRTRQEMDDTGQVYPVSVEFPIWMEAHADGGTPMCQALGKAIDLCREWIPAANHMECFPPLVINITDGQPTDGSPEDVIKQANILRSLRSNDGDVLLFNCHLSANKAPEVVYPAPGDPLPPDPQNPSRPDPCAQMLFDMSSELPEGMRDLAREVVKVMINPAGRGFLFNADIKGVMNMINIGTQTPGVDPNR